jgi:tetratricopeptide (TPR) repeat protein
MGDMEASFHGHHRYAEALMIKAGAENTNGDLEAAKTSIAEAANELGKIIGLHNPWGEKGIQLFLKIHTTRALILETAGDYAGAIQQYEAMCAAYFGASGHFLVAFFYTKRAEVCQKEGRSEDALRLYMESKQRAAHVSVLPDGITPEIKMMFEEYVSKQIESLTALNVKPSAEINF